MNPKLSFVLLCCATLPWVSGTFVAAQVVNGSFESGAAAWTFTGGLSILGPPAYPAAGLDGTHVAAIGGADIPNSTLSQSFPVLAGTNYLLTLHTAAGGDGFPGRTSVVRVDVFDSQSVLIESRSFTNVSVGPLIGGIGFTQRGIRFTTPTYTTNATLVITDTSPGGGVAVDPIIDAVTVELLSLHATIRCSEVEVCWQSETNTTYRLQYRSATTTNLWTDLGLAVLGNGSEQCGKDAVPAGEPQRFYRVTAIR